MKKHQYKSKSYLYQTPSALFPVSISILMTPVVMLRLLRTI